VDSKAECDRLNLAHETKTTNASAPELNATKTEFVGFVPTRRRHDLPSDQLCPGAPVTLVRNLDIYLVTDMSVKSHVMLLVLVGACVGVLRQIRFIRRSLSDSTLTMTMTSFMMSKLDYCNVVFTGHTVNLTDCSPWSTLPRVL